MDIEVGGLEDLKRTEEVTALKIPMVKTSQFLIKLAPYLLNQDYSQNVVQDPSKSFSERLVLLNKTIDENLTNLPENLKEWVKEEKVEVSKHQINVDANSYSQDQLLKKVLPSNLNSHVKSETLQDISVLELDPEQQKHKKLIAKIVEMKSKDTSKAVLLRKATSTNLDKPNSEWGKYFLDFEFEVLSGDKDLNRTFKEGNADFELNLNDVHYYTFMQVERDRLVSTFNKESTFVDLFGDIITSIRMALNRVWVYINCNQESELNHALLHNLDLPSNSLAKDHVQIFNEDLASLLIKLFHPQKSSEIKEIKNIYSGRIISDITFIHEFVGIFNTFGNKKQKPETLPVFHFYYLANNSDFTESMRKVISKKLNTSNPQLTEILKNNNIEELFTANDIIDLFIVDAHFHGENRLIQVSLQISQQVAYFDKYESKLVSQIRQLQPSNGSVDVKSPTPKKKRNTKTVAELETEVNTEEVGGSDSVRRSTRKRQKPKSYEDYSEE